MSLLDERVTLDLSLKELAVLVIGYGQLTTEEYNNGVNRNSRCEFKDELISEGDGLENDLPYNLYGKIKDLAIEKGVL